LQRFTGNHCQPGHRQAEAMLKTYLAVALGGAVGTVLRLWLSGFLAVRYGETFPVGTLVVNVSGCFVIGLFNGLTGPEGVILSSSFTRQVVMIGVLGGYTTFSSFSLQTLNLLNDGEWLRGSMNIFLSVALCMIGVWLGHSLAALLNQR
jgi:CrcB protein